MRGTRFDDVSSLVRAFRQLSSLGNKNEKDKHKHTVFEDRADLEKKYNVETITNDAAAVAEQILRKKRPNIFSRSKVKAIRCSNEVESNDNLGRSASIFTK